MMPATIPQGNAILVTGVTGFLGRELVKRVAQNAAPDTEIACVVRAKTVADAGERIAGLRAEVEAAGHHGERVRAYRGDLEHDRLGLGEHAYRELAARTVRVIHGAATVRFDHPLEEARAINVEGTRRVLEFAAEAHRAGALKRLDYIGTTYVAGRRTGLVHEPDLRDADGFHNTYEHTKFEAEGLVRAKAGELPVAIFRPSIIVGDSRTGQTSHFKVLYWPLKIFSRGLVPLVPASRAGIVDIVPVDFVCDALEHLSSRPESIGQTYHLAAGPEHATTVGQLVDMAAAFFQVRKPVLVPPRIFYAGVRPVLYAVAWGKRRRALISGRVYVPYFNYQAWFDTSAARQGLAGAGIAPPSVESYFHRLLEFCVATEWGRNPEGAGGLA